MDETVHYVLEALLLGGFGSRLLSGLPENFFPEQARQLCGSRTTPNFDSI
jgi:hypothetical protein